MKDSVNFLKAEAESEVPDRIGTKWININQVACVQIECGSGVGQYAIITFTGGATITVDDNSGEVTKLLNDLTNATVKPGYYRT